VDAHTFTKQASNFKQTLSACKKADDNCFFAEEGSADVEFMQQVTTITSEVYCETLKELLMAIYNKRHGMLTPSVLLLQDNASAHTDARTRALLEHFNWELFDHPLYSPDLAPSDYPLFTYRKKWLR
jgi:histone-lysine N-methyltransferase SETMAR